MDALEILSNLDSVFPYFQPIFSADEMLVIAYEVLGRYNSDGEIISLGPFFNDDQIPDEYKYEVDLILVKKALEKALGVKEEIKIFLNRDADLLMFDHGEAFLHELLAFEKRGLSLSRIVLEISDYHYRGDLDQFDNLLHYYRTYGIKIAISRLGRESHSFTRIGRLEPDILKINLQALKSTSTGTNFNDVLFAISLLARKIGADLLFENIEMSYQLQFAWKNGGRYYQGFYLSPPADDFVPHDLLKNRLKEKFHDFNLYEKRKLEAVYSTAETLQGKVQEIFLKNKKSNHEDLLKAIAKELDEMAFRMYICDEDGFQVSGNLFKGNDSWHTQMEYLNKNWSWRPYFLETIIKMRNDRKGILSDLYCDIETGESVRTFSLPVYENNYLFIDISYRYLFEHDELL
ncbi:EAL-associated domain-containing protein [Neobacillus sp. Marseille-QA0830]